MSVREVLLACLLAIAIALIVAGVALISVPAAFIFAGLGVAGLAFLTLAEVR